jgi:hypothetical protein
MSIFSRRSKSSTAELDQIVAMRERAKSMREQIGRRDMQLPDLFAMLSEDERTAYSPPHGESETVQG